MSRSTHARAVALRRRAVRADPAHTPAELFVQRATTGDVFGSASHAPRRAVHPLPRTRGPRRRGRGAGVPGGRRAGATPSCNRSTSWRASSTSAPGRATSSRSPPRPDPLPARLRRALPGLREGPQSRAARPRRSVRRPALGGARGAPRTQATDPARRSGSATMGRRSWQSRRERPRSPAATSAALSTGSRRRASRPASSAARRSSRIASARRARRTAAARSSRSGHPLPSDRCRSASPSTPGRRPRPEEIVAGAVEAAAEAIEPVLFGPAGLDTQGLELVPMRPRRSTWTRSRPRRSARSPTRRSSRRPRGRRRRRRRGRLGREHRRGARRLAPPRPAAPRRPAPRDRDRDPRAAAARPS